MKLLLAGGGTAGHINPALAIAGYVCQREPATQILLRGSQGRHGGEIGSSGGL